MDARQKTWKCLSALTKQTVVLCCETNNLLGVDYLNIMSFALETKWYIMYQASNVVLGHIPRYKMSSSFSAIHPCLPIITLDILHIPFEFQYVLRIIHTPEINIVTPNGNIGYWTHIKSNLAVIMLNTHYIIEVTKFTCFIV